MNWLTKLRNKKKITQKELSKLTGININTIQNIEQEKRKGSKETIDKLMKYFESSDEVSYDSEELIEEIKCDIEEFGEEHFVYAMFNIIDSKLFLTNYDFIAEEEPLIDNEKNEFDLIIEIKLKDVLKILELQNRIF